MKKIIVSMIYACIMMSFLSCSNEDSVLQPQVSEATAVSNGPFKVAAATGWVMQTWNFSGVSSKRLYVGSLGLVVSGQNNGTGVLNIYVQQRDGADNIITENVSSFQPNETKIIVSTLPNPSIRSVIITVVRTSSTGTVVGTVLVNSKY